MASDHSGMKLDAYTVGDFSRGAPKAVELLWQILQAAFLSSWIPGSAHRRLLLRLFGAKLGKRVTIKPGVKVKFPWRLEVGDYSWIGEHVWIDNLAVVKIGANCCISQDVYFCTGNHDWSRPSFDLSCHPITLGDSVWIGARGTLAPGAGAGDGAVLAMGSVAVRTLQAWTIYRGVPAEPIGPRRTKCAMSFSAHSDGG